jgi:hypothetical protein
MNKESERYKKCMLYGIFNDYSSEKGKKGAKELVDCDEFDEIRHRDLFKICIRHNVIDTFTGKSCQETSGGSNSGVDGQEASSECIKKLDKNKKSICRDISSIKYPDEYRFCIRMKIIKTAPADKKTVCEDINRNRFKEEYDLCLQSLSSQAENDFNEESKKLLTGRGQDCKSFDSDKFFLESQICKGVEEKMKYKDAKGAGIEGCEGGSVSADRLRIDCPNGDRYIRSFDGSSAAGRRIKEQLTGAQEDYFKTNRDNQIIKK